MSNQPTCEDRIGDELASRTRLLADLTEVAAGRIGDDEIEGSPEIARLYEDGAIDSPKTCTADELQEQAQTRLYELPLAVSTHKVHRIELSYGGPQDFYEVHVDEDGDIQRITYHFLDWFDGAHVELSGSDYEAAAEFARALLPEDGEGNGIR